MARKLSQSYTREQAKELARVVESGIMNCLFNAQMNPDREDYWRKHADILESKFTTDFGRHYSYWLYEVS